MSFVLFILALFIVFSICLFRTRKIKRDIDEIVEFSKSIASGNLDRRLSIRERGKLNDLAENLNIMAAGLKHKLKEDEEVKHRTEAILRSMSDGLLLVDTEGMIVLANPGFKKLLAVDGEIEGKPFMEVLRNAELQDVMNRAREDKKTISHEIEVAYPKELHLMTTAVPVYSLQEEVTGVVLALHNITRLKQLEEMRKDFVANVSHEIKTPITAIKGFAETLLEGAIDDKENATKFLETIKNHSERLNSLVDDLLTLSKIELGGITIEKQPTDISNVIDTVFTTLRENARNKGLYLKKSIPEGTPKVPADRDKLVQILLNLVDNGIKFTEDGGVTVKVRSLRLHPEAQPEGFKVQSETEVVDSPLGDFVEISVEDTGIGIPKKHIQRLGERFYRVDNTRSRELGGTGLGLAIVKHLTKAHGWNMEIESAPGMGTKVKLILANLPLFDRNSNISVGIY